MKPICRVSIVATSPDYSILLDLIKWYRDISIKVTNPSMKNAQ